MMPERGLTCAISFPKRNKGKKWNVKSMKGAKGRNEYAQKWK